MTGSSKQTTTQTSATEPWGPSQDILKQGLSQASGVNPSAFAEYGGSTVIPNSTQTDRGLYGIEQLARTNEGTGSLGRQYQSIIDSGGYNDAQIKALGGMQGLASNANNPSYSEQNLAGIARGDMLDRQDPNFERALAAASESAANQINLGASGAGRYGSAVHQGNVAREIGNYEAGQRVNQYNTERQNQVAANSQMDSGMFNRYNLGLSANQNLFNAGQQGFSNLGSAYQAAKAPWQDLMNVGASYEDLASRQKNDEIRLYDAQRQQPLRQAEWLMGIGSGAGSLGGTSSGQSQAPGQSPFATALGYGTGIASLFGGM